MLGRGAIRHWLGEPKDDLKANDLAVIFNVVPDMNLGGAPLVRLVRDCRYRADTGPLESLGELAIGEPWLLCHACIEGLVEKSARTEALLQGHRKRSFDDALADIRRRVAETPEAPEQSVINEAWVRYDVIGTTTVEFERHLVFDAQAGV